MMNNFINPFIDISNMPTPVNMSLFRSLRLRALDDDRLRALNPNPNPDDDDDLSELSGDDDTVYVSNESDVVDATGLDCPICYDKFEKDDVITMFGCNFMHFACVDCAHRMSTGDVCHICRSPVTSVQTFKCVTFDKGEGTAEDPVVVND